MTRKPRVTKQEIQAKHGQINHVSDFKSYIASIVFFSNTIFLHIASSPKAYWGPTEH